jgi:hypothetical protein
MRIRLSSLLQPRSNIAARALFSAISSGISLAVMAIAAVLTHSRFVFPSLGPTAFLFFTTPTAPSASPRNTVIGHAIGAGAGYFSLVVTGLTMTGPALIFGVTWRHVIAAGLSLALTAGFMVLLDVPHPPAGATTLLISLGIMSKPAHLGILMLAVGVLTLQAIIINRFLGIPFPLWSPLPTPEVDSKKAPINEKTEKTGNPNSSKRTGRAAASAERAELVEMSPARRRALFGVMLALLAREAERPEADQELLATLASAAEGRYPPTWSEAQRGRAVAHDLLEPLSVLALLSAVKQGEAAVAPEAAVPDGGEQPKARRSTGRE